MTILYGKKLLLTVTFDIKKFKLPLKFIGSEQATPAYPENEEQVKGKITLNYIIFRTLNLLDVDLPIIWQ